MAPWSNLFRSTIERKETIVTPPGALAAPGRGGGYSIFSNLSPAGEAPQNDAARIKAVQGHPVAMACVRKIAWNTASVKFGVEFLNGDIDFDHPIAQRIEEPNTEGGRCGLIQLLAASLAVCGRAYVYGLPSIFPGDPPSALIFLRPDHLTRQWNQDGTLRCYHYNTMARGVVELDPSTVCELKHPWIGDTSSYPGAGMQEAYSQLEAAWGPFSLYTGLSGLIRKLLHNNGGLPGILTWSGDKDASLSKDQRNSLRDYIKSFRSDGEKFGQIGFLDSSGGKVEFIKITEDFKTLNMEEAKKNSLNEICSVFGVPPLLLMGTGEGATFANMAEARRTFWMETVLPGYVNVIAEALSTWLGVKIRPDLAAVPALSEYRMQMADAIMKMDYLKINEKRALMGYESLLGGDVLMLNPAMLPLNRIINSQSGTLQDQAAWLQDEEKVRELLRTGIMPAQPDGKGKNGSKSATSSPDRKVIDLKAYKQVKKRTAVDWSGSKNIPS